MKHKLSVVLVGVVLGSLLTASAAQAQFNFYIDETTNFRANGGACWNNSLNTVTASLRSSLVSKGWSGSRFVNSQAWPEDFYDRTLRPVGVDHLYGDASRLSVYAGHGNRAFLQFGYPGPFSGRCNTVLDSDSFLGRASGGQAGAVMYLTSCTLNTSAHARFHRHLSRQHFGYHNSPPIKDDQPRDFFNATLGRSNTRAWLDEMEDRPGWFTGDNSPIALSYGVNSADAVNVRDNARLRLGTFLGTVSHTYYYWIMRDHGAGGC